MSTIATSFDLDEVLLQGDQLHGLFNASLRRAKADKLSFDEMQETVKSILGDNENLYQFGPIHCGDILASAAEPPYATLDQALEDSKKSTGALLRVGEYTSAVQVNTDGSVRVFDPHARDESGYVNGNGTSVVIDSKDKSSFHSYLRRFVFSNGTGHSTSCFNDTSSIPYTLRSFELIPLIVRSHNCLPNLLKTIQIGNAPVENPSSNARTENRSENK